MNIEEIKEKFESENIKTYFVKSKKEAVETVLGLISKNVTVGYGGSVTLEEIGVLNELRKRSDITLYDRDNVIPFTKESNDLGHLAQHANVFLSSSNAVTEDGKIVNKDGTGNRVSSLIYGPEKVIVVVGKNKVVKNVEKAFERIENIAAPKNALRKEANTPCVYTGKCSDCSSPDRLCCNTVIIERQHKKDRMFLIIVDEDLGY